ncbi:MAG: hypothetical protein DRI86_13575 [Bacteroidetes bacterium]|nr:MAG: hypothetical protein DRI86_13575 [Bacteroidota bacterium]
MKKEERYSISVSREQLSIIMDTLENMSRFNTGQVSEIFKDVLWNSDRISHDDIDELTKVVKSKVFPDLQPNAYFSVGIRENDKLSELKQKQYEIYRELRHQLYMMKPSSDGYSVLENSALIYSDLPKIKLIKEE